MPLNIKDEKTHALARRLAAQTGESLTRAVHDALEEKLQRLALTRAPATLRQELEAIIDRAASRPIKANRTAEDIIGYDENGLPS